VITEANQESFTPAGGIVDVIVMQVLHPISLHFHHRCLSELVTLLFREIHHVLWGGSLTHLFANLGVGLHKGSKCGKG
tara:strand:- start:857 stop:1090 length:234 start_codon:yes stop_codon:yes gene_type:complete